MSSPLSNLPKGPRGPLLARALHYFRSREGEPRLFTKRKLVLLLLAGAYTLSPLDIVPDFIPGIGQLDDLSVIIFTILALFMPPVGRNDADRNEDR